MKPTINTEIMKNHLVFSIGDSVRFTYKGGRKVYGEIVKMENKTILIKLKSNYIGKNDEWFIGELKSFNIKECKKWHLDQKKIEKGPYDEETGEDDMFP